MNDPAAVPPCEAEPAPCHLCGDTAIVGRVTELHTSTRSATVALPTGPAIVAVDLVDVSVGDDVLVHLGFAIERVVAL